MGLGATSNLGMRARLALGSMQVHLLAVGLQPINRSPSIAAAGNELIEDPRAKARNDIVEIVEIGPRHLGVAIEQISALIHDDVCDASSFSSSNRPLIGSNQRIPEKYRRAKAQDSKRPHRVFQGR